jgi:hypothetical protein
LPIELSARYFIGEQKEIIHEAIQQYHFWRSLVLDGDNLYSTVSYVNKWIDTERQRFDRARKASPIASELLAAIPLSRQDCFTYSEYRPVYFTKYPHTAFDSNGAPDAFWTKFYLGREDNGATSNVDYTRDCKPRRTPEKVGAKTQSINLANLTSPY